MLRYKILIGVLVTAIIILSGFTYHYYSVGISQQATINNMQGQAIENIRLTSHQVLLRYQTRFYKALLR